MARSRMRTAVELDRAALLQYLVLKRCRMNRYQYQRSPVVLPGHPGTPGPGGSLMVEPVSGFFTGPPRPQTTPMKHLWKKFERKGKKSPQPPQQTNSSGRPTDTAAGPPAFHTELDGILNGRQSFLSGSGGKLFRSVDFTRRGRRGGPTDYVSRRNGCGPESPCIGSFDVWLCDC